MNIEELFAIAGKVEPKLCGVGKIIANYEGDKVALKTIITTKVEDGGTNAEIISQYLNISTSSIRLHRRGGCSCREGNK